MNCFITAFSVWYSLTGETMKKMRTLKKIVISLELAAVKRLRNELIIKGSRDHASPLKC